MTDRVAHPLDLRIPPPLVALVLAGLMWGTARVTPVIPLAVPLRGGLALLLAALGLALGVAGTLAFRRARTTVNPLRPERSSSLVADGVYRHSRNPMYAGMLLGLLGWAAWLAAPAVLLGPALFVALITEFQIKPEEQVLATKFGADYDRYLGQVRRWL